MWRKKLMTATAAGMLMAALVTFPALAHGHHRQASVPVSTSTTTSASVSDTANLACPLAGCGQTGYHSHDGHDYWGCYQVCTVDGCTTIGHHTHDSQECWGYYPVCSVEGCTQAGHHTHDGHGYCGYNHSSGYCDNSCQTYYSTTGSYGHHGCR